MTTIEVDFNDVERDGRMVALLEQAQGPVVPGAVVILREGGDNIVQARVLSVMNDLLTLEVDWASWNRVNTLMDALDASVKAAREGVGSLDHLFERRPTGFDPDELPGEVKIAN